MNIFNLKRRTQKYLDKYDHYAFIWYCGHRLFFNSLISRGKRLWAFNFLLKIKIYLKNKEHIDPFWLFLIAILKILPEIILFPRKLGGRTQGIPLPIAEWKQYSYFCYWTIKLVKTKSRILTVNLLGETLANAIYNKGDAIEKKNQTYNISTENRYLLRLFRR